MNSIQMDNAKIEKKAMLAVLLGNAIFGFSFLFSKLALQITIPAVLIAVRFTVAFLLLNIIIFVGRRLRREDGSALIEFSVIGKPVKDVLLLAFFQPVLYFISENYGIVYTSSAFAGIIISIIPITGIMFDVLIMRAKVTLKQVICAVCSVIGVVITTIGATNMTSSLKGTMFLLLAVISGSVFYVFSKKAGAYYSALEKTYVMFGVGSVFYIIVSLIQCHGAYDRLIFYTFTQPIFWCSILYLSVFSSVMAFLLLNWGSNFVSISKATLFANFTTVISIAAGVMVLHESFNWQQLVGAVIILTCVYLAR